VAEYFNDDDRVAALRKWWDENGTSLIVGMVLVIGGVVGWRWYTDWNQARQEAASSTFQRYVELRRAGGSDTEGMAQALATLDRDYAGSAYQVFSLLYRAADAIERDSFEDAGALLSQAIDGASDNRLADLARVRLARVQHQLGKDDEAMVTLQGVKGAGFRSYAAELKGDMLLAAGRQDEALAAYRAAAQVEGTDGERPLLKMKISDLTKADTDQVADADAS